MSMDGDIVLITGRLNVWISYVIGKLMTIKMK